MSTEEKEKPDKGKSLLCQINKIQIPLVSCSLSACLSCFQSCTLEMHEDSAAGGSAVEGEEENREMQQPHVGFVVLEE